MKVEITNNLQKIRLEKGLSQTQLAKKSGCTLVVIKKYEQGIVDMKDAKFFNLVNICNGLGCKLSDLFTDETFAKDVRKVQRRQRGQRHAKNEKNESRV